MILGYDHLGAAHRLWPFKDALRYTPKAAAIGLLDYTFGDAAKAFKRYYQAGFRKFRVHFWWSNSHVIAPLSLVKRASSKWERIAKAHPEAIIYISHSLEHNERSVAAVLQRLDVMRELAPSCIPVNCVWKGAAIKGEINEAHEGAEQNGTLDPEYIYSSDGFALRKTSATFRGTLDPEYIYSSDGVSILELRAKVVRADHRKALFVFGWIPSFNLRSESGIQPPPKLRKRVPTAKEFKEVVKHLEG